MSTETSEITVSGMRVSILRKPIKNLHLGVYPPRGRVRVAAPLAVSDDAVRLAVIGRLGWIRRQQAKFKAQPRQSEREMVSGESHYFLGRRYRLQVVHHDSAVSKVVVKKARIELHVRASKSAQKRRDVLESWYRRQLRALLPAMAEKWQPALGVEASGWGIRRMRTKWGTCTVGPRRIWLNLELAKKPVGCIEYVVVHELVHLIEPHHGERFVALMDRHMPSWRRWRKELGAKPLAHEEWEC